MLGSATAIMAMGLARLGTPVAFVGRVGDDVWGRYCLDAMAGRGIDLSRVLRGGGLKTGITVSISDRADRALVTYLGAISALTGADVPDHAMAGLDHLHVSSFFFQEGLRPHFPDLFARARRAGLTTSLDTGFDPSERWDGGLRETLRETDLFFPNEVELEAITGSADPAEGLRRLENGRTRVVAKLGKDGAMTLDGGRVVRVSAYPVETVDTTGAGDSFNAGFLHRVARRRAPRRLPAAGCRLRGAQHARARRHRDAADARGSRGPHASSRAMTASPLRAREPLLGHTRRVGSVALSADGALLLSGSLDRAVRVWNVSDGACVKVLAGETSDVNAVALSPDGKVAVSGFGEMTLKAGLARVWDVAAGKPLLELAGHEGEVSAVALDARRGRVATGGADDTVRLWELESGRCLRVLKGHDGWVRAVAFTADGSRVVSGGMDGTVRVWDAVGGTLLRTLGGQADRVYAVATSPDGRWALAGAKSHELRLWDLGSGECVRVFEGHDGVVRGAAFLPDGRWALSASEDKTVRMWELATGRGVATEPTTGAALCLAVSADGRRAAVGTYDRRVLVWDVGRPA